MKKLLFILLLFFPILSQAQPAQNEKKASLYLRHIGDSEFWPGFDDPSFKPCDGETYVIQYFNSSQGLQYEGEKSALVEAFQAAYQPIDTEESGWVRIRFMVNCEGKTGRYRIQAADYNYRPVRFDERIISQLVKITHSLEGWLPQRINGRVRDYYQYLIFKIEKGQLKEILP